MEAYFDNSATTKVLDSVKDIVVKTMTGAEALKPLSSLNLSNT